MISVDRLIDLFRHMQWADRTVIGLVLKTEACTVDERILDTLHHMVATQLAFMDVWSEREFVFRRREDAGAEQIADLSRSFFDDAEPWLGTLSDDQLSSQLVVPWTKWKCA